ncbi:RNA polymerase sigma-70 factor [Oerskovia flava]|uniref:RNA polymerase sigma-70 factor n=1 Tax=Oerskovia flava TaxID=2986422 RepID=UPI00224009EC|nr:RNA polymerase sigma-70 factor [Oerskovia sp. JB1-3-2]
MSDHRGDAADHSAGPVGPFVEHRRLLFTVAYEMLGSAQDAEDVVQEVWLRWSAADRDDVRDARAYLVRVTTRLALNRLRTLRSRRETYVGPWLPDPMLTAPDAAAPLEQAEDVSIALLVVLETLSPTERAVFVLHEVFGVGYAEIADTLDRRVDGVRQIAHRAREHVRARRPRFAPADVEPEEVTRRFLEACVTGDVGTLVEVLAPDVVFVSDGGGKAKAALRPISGADKVSRALVGFAAKPETTALRFEPTGINGELGGVWWDGDRVVMGAAMVLDGDRIARVYVFRNPDRLAGLRRA